MKPVEKRLAAKKALIPSSGYNLVGVDPIASEPGEELYLVAHFTEEAMALKEKGIRESTDPDEKLFIYGPDTA